MARLNISGLVTYMNGTPARNARVRIYDKDPGANQNDLILNVRTGSDGKFSGLSSDYADGGVFDLMDLEFRVDSDARAHIGPFFLFNGASVPVVLPWLPGTNREERHLLHVITLSQHSNNRALYETIEFGAKALALPFGSANYKSYTALEAEQATKAKLIGTLSELAAQSTTEAVDLLFCTHGSSEAVHFADAAIAAAELREALLTIPAERRRKLRAVFSTACFGRTHLDAWTLGGFKVASGSKGVYVDSALSFPVFLGAWNSGMTFLQAVQAANAADPARTQEAIAKAYYESRGEPATGKQIDSKRSVRGNGGLRINSQIT